jgi:hypothetical protein
VQRPGEPDARTALLINAQTVLLSPSRAPLPLPLYPTGQLRRRARGGGGDITATADNHQQHDLGPNLVTWSLGRSRRSWAREQSEKDWWRPREFFAGVGGSRSPCPGLSVAHCGVGICPSHFSCLGHLVGLLELEHGTWVGLGKPSGHGAAVGDYISP